MESTDRKQEIVFGLTWKMVTMEEETDTRQKGSKSRPSYTTQTYVNDWGMGQDKDTKLSKGLHLGTSIQQFSGFRLMHNEDTENYSITKTAKLMKKIALALQTALQV